ncbi:sodium:proton antiporter [Pacificimonas flava]|uniref:Sodium:proton antiporter n=2 Tax=Pacificimonas TaxID=1960290 RepID=A0A219B5D0_9SPHN|nr:MULTISPECIES: sodium:proton antiporter [Pacificimonas]MBZ6377290.1 sodium:proton antiporter [Pacificimonas aurantium]OWV32999.1 sodium:proton antiporter [Pacificimonas flava]
MEADLTIKLAAIGAIGISAQWIAWRTGWPAIALMLLGGILAGPVTGYINPIEDFGELYQPAIKLAVAVILFEGGLSLNFRELRQSGWAVGRLVVIGAPVAWTLGAICLHFAAGLPWEPAILFAGILVVTGPTVIGPMLRQLRIGNRPRDILKWEGIVNDPLGALFAVVTLAWITYADTTGQGSVWEDIGLHIGAASLFAIGLGVALAYLIKFLFPRGHVPEFLKTPVVFGLVIVGFVLADFVEHETGLLTVTAMGIALANMRLDSFGEMRRFKESVTILLLSGVFVILSATLNMDILQSFELRFVVFLALLLFFVRPASVLIALAFSSVPWREQLFIAWVAPRGVVCVAITGLFAIRLEELGYVSAEALNPLAFAVVIVTIIAHGFSAKFVAQRLGIDQGPGRSTLIVGANRWSIELGQALAKRNIPVHIADTSYLALRRARQAGLETHHGEALEAIHADHLDIGSFQAVIAATDNDAYNSLICAELGPEIGRNAVFQVGTSEAAGTAALPGALKGRDLLKSGAGLMELLNRQEKGWEFRQTRIGEKYSLSDLRKRLSQESELLGHVKPSLELSFFTNEGRPAVDEGDYVIAYVPPGGDAADEEDMKERQDRAREAKGQKERKNAKAEAEAESATQPETAGSSDSGDAPATEDATGEGPKPV